MTVEVGRDPKSLTTDDIVDQRLMCSNVSRILYASSGRDVFILHLIFDISIPKIILKNHYIFDTSVKIRGKI